MVSAIVITNTSLVNPFFSQRKDIFSRVDRQLIREGALLIRDVKDAASGTMSLKKPDWKEHYFFLFDDFLLEVTKPTKAEKYKFIKNWILKYTSILEQLPADPIVDITAVEGYIFTYHMLQQFSYKQSQTQRFGGCGDDNGNAG